MSIIQGIATFDADYKPTKYEVVNGKSKLVWRCPYYTRWMGMVNRCYSKTSPSHYEDCTVSDNWLVFSNFKSWMEKQDWEDKQLDKDLLVRDNKVYSDLTCIFISSRLNTTISGLFNDKGCTYDKSKGLWQAQIKEYPSKVAKIIGRFNTEEEAHSVWVSNKIRVLKGLIKDQTDLRIQSAINRIIEELN